MAIGDVATGCTALVNVNGGLDATGVRKFIVQTHPRVRVHFNGSLQHRRSFIVVAFAGEALSQTTSIHGTSDWHREWQKILIYKPNSSVKYETIQNECRTRKK